MVRFTRKPAMFEKGNASVILDDAGTADGVTDIRYQETLL